MSKPDLITIQLDAGTRAVPHGSTLAELLVLLEQPPQAVATAVNGRFVARPLRAQHRLEHGDTVLLFQPIVGG